MARNSWQSSNLKKIVSAQEALSNIRNGQTIFISTGCAEPVLLTKTLSEMAIQFYDVQIIHLLSQIDQGLARSEYVNSIRCNTFCVGTAVEAAVSEGIADYTPINIRELHIAMARGIVVIDIALIQVSTPDSQGRCSLGISVDVVKATVDNAKIVIAQVNDNMPETMGCTDILIDKIDYLVAGDAPLIEVKLPKLDPISLTIGRHIANLIRDGMTLHFDCCVISSATMRYLDTKKDLGIHTDIFTDDYLRLLKSGAVTNSKKKIHKDKSIATTVLGSKELYDAVDKNPDIELYPIEYVNDPMTISQNENMTSILSIQEIDLSGLARSEIDCSTKKFNFLSCADFNNGTRFSNNGLVIMALPSTTSDGQKSTIVPMMSGRGEYSNRQKVDIVVTEYGSVNLYGRSIRERAVSLISISHPKFRNWLLKEAKKLHYVDEKQIISPESGCVYPNHYEFYHTFSDGLEVFFRPVKPLDAKGLQRLFYTLSKETIRLRYHGSIKSLSNEVLQGLTNIDYNKDMAILGLIGPRSNPQIITEARYSYNPINNMGDFDFLVSEDYRGRGIGLFLANYLKKIAYARGLSGLYGEIILNNSAVIRLLAQAWPTAEKLFDSGVCKFTIRFPEEDVKRPKDSIIIYSSRFNDFSYGEGHPFRPDRAKSTLELIIKEDFDKEPWIRIEEPMMISKKRL